MQRIHAELKQPAPSCQQLEELGRKAVASGENSRWLEGYLARLMD